MKYDEHINKIIIFLATAAIGAGASAYVKLERLEAKFEALDLEEIPAMVQKNQLDLAVMTAELKSINNNLSDLKDILREDD
jgi:hypothetical protein